MRTLWARWLVWLAAACGVGPCGLCAAAADPPQQVDVYVSGRDGYDTYRIPSAIVTKQGTVLAFCEGRRHSASDSGDIDLLVKRSSNGGKTFSKFQVVWDDGPNTCGNPCPVVDRRTGAIVLLMTHNLGSDEESRIIAGTSKGTRTVWKSESRDDGLTWSRQVEITSTTKKSDWTWYATGPGAGIQLKSGRLVVPCDCVEAGTKRMNSHVIFSDDSGAAWRLGGSTGPAADECEVVERNDGSLLLNIRNYNRRQKCRTTATSTDGGLTWSAPAFDKTLVEPVCQASIRRFSWADGGGKSRILFSNPASDKVRENMTVRLSYDEGKTWPASKLLYKGPAAYSCLAVTPGGTILCLYERGTRSAYEKITLARFDLAWLSDDKDR
jgi:sialidase-1